jgi:hypothetical protein
MASLLVADCRLKSIGPAAAGAIGLSIADRQASIVNEHRQDAERRRLGHRAGVALGAHA